MQGRRTAAPGSRGLTGRPARDPTSAPQRHVSAFKFILQKLTDPKDPRAPGPTDRSTGKGASRVRGPTPRRLPRPPPQLLLLGLSGRGSSKEEPRFCSRPSTSTAGGFAPGGLHETPGAGPGAGERRNRGPRRPHPQLPAPAGPFPEVFSGISPPARSSPRRSRHDAYPWLAPRRERGVGVGDRQQKSENWGLTLTTHSSG